MVFCAMISSASALWRATVHSSVTETMPRSSAGRRRAWLVIVGISRYTCIESTTRVVTIAPCSRVSASARASETSLFPLAVGPQTTRAFLFCSAVRLPRLPGVQDVRPRRLYPGPDVLSGLSVRPDVHGVAAPGLAYGLAVLGAPVPDVHIFQASHLALVAREGVLLDRS